MRVYLQKHKWMTYLIPCIISFSLFVGLCRMMTVEGADNNPRFVMIRLEDIGPGGYYGSSEGLGKLRAVFEFLHDRHVRFSMAVVPRWINISSDGIRYDRSLDQMGDSYVQSFNMLLHQAVGAGATLGMHGYTHQVGDVIREDGHHASGIGNEFNIPGMDETATALFADQRVNEGIRIFHQAGFLPHFWEAPHYHTNPGQDHVFQSYFGLMYQPQIALNPNPAAAQYNNDLNKGYGAPSLGAVYVPTPLTYIPGNRDEKVILNQIGKTNRVNSFFYHPFLEFSHLTPVVDRSGNTVIRDGLPEYQYAEGNKSNLQKLIAQIEAKGYAFYNIHDYVPFTPAHRVKVGNDKDPNVQIGDVTGRGEADLVTWEKKTGNVSVIEGHFKELRNESQPAPKVWTTMNKADGAAFTLNNTNGDGKKGLWVVQPTGKLESYFSNGSRFVLNHRWTIPANRWLDVFELRQPGGDCVLAGQSQDRTQLLGIYLHNGVAKAIKPYTFKSDAARELIVRDLKKEGRQSLFLSKTDSSQGVQLDWDRDGLQWKVKKVAFNIPAELGDIRFGDFNGDGKEDILRWDAKNLTSRVYHQTGENEYKLLSVFGPWGQANSRLVVADFDGNGEQDIALIGKEDANMDIALSYQSRDE
ncbi:DUF2334 domain-containing protein [Paenibacillus sp. GCM10027628]|uniref:DUF2334 domain-containing protein n=1 Tax=Paenibacillus sp. GCM10027628 TaxID=3273413 RepID=UPI0036382EB2